MSSTIKHSLIRFYWCPNSFDSVHSIFACEYSIW